MFKAELVVENVGIAQARKRDLVRKDEGRQADHPEKIKNYIIPWALGRVTEKCVAQKRQGETES